MKTGIYAIWNSHSNKIYIGQAVDIKKRWKNHKIELRLNRHRNVYLQSAYNKYNIGLVFYVMEFCDYSLLDEREQFYMDLHNSYDREYGYNLSPTAGGSCTGYKHSEETKRKSSESHKALNVKHTDEFKEAARQRMIGNQVNLGRKQSSDVVENRIKKNTGRKRTPEQIQNILEGQRRSARLRFKALMFID